MQSMHRTRTQPEKWREERNRSSLARLMKALPAVFPAPVLGHALSRPFVPPVPRLAVDAYWRAHPLRAERLSRALAARSGAPDGWSWRLGSDRQSGLSASFRVPPTPYREQEFKLGPGHCCVCGQKVHRFGWHVDVWRHGPNRNAEWHACCVVAWRLWNAPSDQVRILKRLQRQRCAQTGKRLRRTAEVDHRVPLFKVWREHRGASWPELLGFWGLPNLQVINRDIHLAKCASEAKSRIRISRADEPFWPSVRHLMESLEGAPAFSGKAGGFA
jgi:hypothetical protein